jgi:hypothetical protein
MGYSWVWRGLNTEAPYDLVWEARERWHAPEAPRGAFWYTREDGWLRGVFRDFPLDTTEDLSKYAAGNYQAKEFLSVRQLDPNTLDPGVVSKRMQYIRDDELFVWLQKKENFDRTFPEKAGLDERGRQRLFDHWRSRQEGVERARKARFARVDYRRVGLELLALTLVCGAALLLAWQKSGSS